MRSLRHLQSRVPWFALETRPAHSCRSTGVLYAAEQLSNETFKTLDLNIDSFKGCVVLRIFTVCFSTVY